VLLSFYSKVDLHTFSFLLYEFLGEQEIRIRDYVTASCVFFIFNKNLIFCFNKKYLYKFSALLKISIKNNLKSFNHFLIARNLSYHLYHGINTYKKLNFLNTLNTVFLSFLERERTVIF
jgi:hypothetical protein